MSSRPVAVFVHGRGRGHATRSLPIIQRLLDQGHSVQVYAGEEARPVLAPFRPTFVASVPARPTLGGAGVFAQRLAEAYRDLAGVEVVLSDGDHPALLAAKARGIRAIAVGHGLVFSQCQRPPGLPRGPWRREAVKAGLSSFPAHAHVAVNFGPLDLRPSDNTYLARPSLDPRLAAVRDGRRSRGLRTPAERVVAYFSGIPLELQQQVLEIVHRTLPSAAVTWFSDASVQVPGVERRPRERDDFVEALIGGDLVVATAGSQLIAECAAIGRPIYALHPADHDEQRLNVGMLAAMGAGAGGAIRPFDAEALRRFLLDPPQPAASAWIAPDAADVVARLVQNL